MKDKQLLLDLFEQAIASIDAHLDNKVKPGCETVENVMDQFEDPMMQIMKVAKQLMVPQMSNKRSYDLFDVREDLMRAYSFIKFNC